MAAHIVDAYQMTLAIMTDIARDDVHPGNRVHVPRCVEFLSSMKSARDLQSKDNNIFAVKAGIPASVQAEIIENFPSEFRKALTRSISKKSLKERVVARIALAKHNAIKKANSEPGYEGVQQLPKGLFDGEIAEDDFDGSSDENPRVALAVASFYGEVNDYGCFNISDSGSYSLDHEGLESALLKRRVDEIREDAKRFSLTSEGPAMVAGKGGKAIAGARSVSASFKSGAKPAAAQVAPLSLRIYSKSILEEIVYKLESDDIDEQASAIDILYLLSNNCVGALYKHFVELLEDGRIIELLKRRYGEKLLPENYRDKITCNSATGKRDGVLEKYAFLSGKKKRLPWLYGSTEECKSVMEASGIQLPREIGMASIQDFRRNFGQLLKRGDFDDQLQGILIKYCPIKLFAVVDHYLIGAIQHNKLPLVEALLEKGMKNESVGKGLIFAASQGRAEILKLLLSQKDVNVNHVARGDSPLTLVITNGKIDAARILLEVKGIDVNHVGSKGACSLYIACYAGNEPLIDDILATPGVKVDQISSVGGGETSLQLATRRGNLNVVNVLLARDADPDLGGDGNELTPLRMAINSGNLGIVNALLDRGVNLHKPTRDTGETPLALAINLYGERGGEGDEVIEDILERLMEVTFRDNSDIAFINHKNSEGDTYLHLATIAGNTKCVDWLLSNGASVDEVNNDDRTPLFEVIDSGHAIGVECLLLHEKLTYDEGMLNEILGAQIPPEDKSQMLISVVKRFAKFGELGSLESFLQRVPAEDVDKIINEIDEEGQTLLGYAVENGSLEVVKKLLTVLNIDVNGGDINKSPLSLALLRIIEGDEDEKVIGKSIMKVLMKMSGINVNACYRGGSDILTMAQEYGDKEVLSLLRDPEEVVMDSGAEPARGAEISIRGAVASAASAANGKRKSMVESAVVGNPQSNTSVKRARVSSVKRDANVTRG